MKSVSLTVEGKKLKVDYREHFANLARINHALNRGVHDHFTKIKETYVDVPEIVGITGACENVDTLFKVANRKEIPLFFTQTGQLSLEQALQSFHGVYAIIHSGRDEEIEDERHLRQFRLTEEEFDCTMGGMNRENYDEEKMYEALLNHIQSTIQDILKEVINANGSLLEKVYGRNISKLKKAAETDFYRIDYAVAVQLLQKNGFSELVFGDDLTSGHEAEVVRLLNKNNEEIPVFIMRYPEEIKFFNMKESIADSSVVLSADLILPYSGEAVGSAVREHDFNRLDSRLRKSTMFDLHVKRGGRYEDFAWYMNIIKQQGTMPHAGYGLGNERLMQYVFGTNDIRVVSLFSLLAVQSGDWDESKYGQASLHATSKKNILVSVGRTEDKKFLLEALRKLSVQTQHVLHATEKTHNYLAEHGIQSQLVFKVSDVGKYPNISDMLGRRIFDLVINIPTRTKVEKSAEFTDGKLIRKGALEVGVSLITDIEVAEQVLLQLAKVQ